MRSNYFGGVSVHTVGSPRKAILPSAGGGYAGQIILPGQQLGWLCAHRHATVFDSTVCADSALRLLEERLSHAREVEGSSVQLYHRLGNVKNSAYVVAAGWVWRLTDLPTRGYHFKRAAWVKVKHGSDDFRGKPLRHSMPEEVEIHTIGSGDGQVADVYVDGVGVFSDQTYATELLRAAMHPSLAILDYEDQDGAVMRRFGLDTIERKRGTNMPASEPDPEIGTTLADLGYRMRTLDSGIVVLDPEGKVHAQVRRRPEAWAILRQEAPTAQD